MLSTFLILVTGCIEETWGTPTSSPTITLAPSPSSSATPEGSLPSVLAELDLGSHVGNAYGPTALAVDDDTAYVLCRRYRSLDAGIACVAVVDLEAGALRDIWPLPGTPTGSLAAGGKRIYAICEREDGEYLLALDAADGRKVYDVDLRSLGYVDGMWMDAQSGRLYLSLSDRLQVRDGRSFDIIENLIYPFKAVERHVAFTEDMDSLLVSLSNAIYAYALPDMTPLWEVEMPLETVRALVVDESGESLMVQGPSAQGEGASQVLVYTLRQGNLEARFPLADEQRGGELVWSTSSSERIVFARTNYPSARFHMLHLWGADTTGEDWSQERRFSGGMLAGGWGSGLCILDRQAHRLIVVDGSTLRVERSIKLGVDLHHLVVDHSRESLYVNDTGATVYEIDIARLQEGGLRLKRSASAGGGEMILDVQNDLLLAARGDGSRVSVVDVDDFQVSHVITGGDRIALDTRRARAIVGSADDVYHRSDVGEIQVWNLMRGERVGIIPQGGIPAYNPLRDEIYVAAYGAYVYDGDSLERIDSLTPDIDAQDCRGCTGSHFVRDLEVDRDLGVLVLRMDVTMGGKGPGVIPSPRFFSLDTLTPVTHTVSVLAGVNGEGMLLPPTDGRVYENMRYIRDASHANLFVRDVESGEIVSWRDGLLLEMLSPDGARGFVPRDDRWLMLDTETWTPQGYVPRYRVYCYDEELDLFFALEGSRLLVMRPRGGEPASPAAPQQAALGGSVSHLHLSPRYKDAKVLFAVSENTLYRSHTDGRHWVRLEGGLPQTLYGADGHLVLALSPAYESDTTLFAGGWDGDGQGFGVWRSFNGGENWQPMWRGLTHLQVEEIVLSQEYGANGTLLARCRYRDLSSQKVGRSLFRSVDRGETWELVAQVADKEEIPQAVELLDEVSKDVGVRVLEGARMLTEEGDLGRPAFSLPAGEFAVTQKRSPFYDRDGTVYVLSSLGLYRSTDGGETWDRAQGELFAGRELEERFTDLDASMEGEGRVLLALGDLRGQVRLVRVEELVWESLPPSP